MPHTLPKLNYDYNALEPHIDAKTMEIHHTKHHQGYVDKLNAALAKYPALQNKPLEGLLRDLDKLDVADADRTAIQNNGGGHANHSLFWTLLDPAAKPDSDLRRKIEKEFGSFESFKEKFSEAAKNQFGSGWAWLVRNRANKLEITSTPNQDSPLLCGDEPLIGLDIWEHAYYLQYQNKRPDYIDAWWNVLKII